MSVLLPAPFSPQSAWTSPSCKSKETPSRARTPGNSLTIERSSSSAISLLLRPLFLRDVPVDLLDLVVAVGDHRGGHVVLVHRHRQEKDARDVDLPVVERLGRLAVGLLARQPHRDL